ncbi:hypothetical protein [Kushneria sp. EE4]
MTIAMFAIPVFLYGGGSFEPVSSGACRLTGLSVLRNDSLAVAEKFFIYKDVTALVIHFFTLNRQLSGFEKR